MMEIEEAGFDSEGLWGSKHQLLRMMLWINFGLFIYSIRWSVSAPPGVTAPGAWRVIYNYGGLACTVFGIIWWLRRFLTLRRIGFEKRLRKRQAK